jgi:lipoate-protein ligase A
LDGAPGLADLQASYRVILGRLQHALTPFATSIQMNGSSDLTLADRKFSGNAQQRKRTHFLHHGTLLYAFDFTQIDRYLKSPPRQPEYRRRRSHAEFLCNLSMSLAQLTEIVRSAWPTDEMGAAIPRDLVARLSKEKYETEEWTRRR